VRCRRVEVASRERRDPVVARQPLAPFVLVALDCSPHERGGLGQLGPEPCAVCGLDRARPHLVELGHGGVEPVARPLEHGERRGLRDAVDRERLPLELARQRLDRPLRPDGVADAPRRHRVRLGEAAQDERPLAQRRVLGRRAVHVPVPEQPCVCLVREEKRVAALERRRDRVEVALAVGVAGRVHRCRDDREGRLRPDRVRVLVPVARHLAHAAGRLDELREEERRRGRDRPRAEGARREVERLHPAERDDHVRLGIDAVLGGDRLAQRG